MEDDTFPTGETMYQPLGEEQMTIYNVEQGLQRKEINNISPVLSRDSRRAGLCYEISLLELQEKG